MTDQAKVAALAAELERIGRMPEWMVRNVEYVDSCNALISESFIDSLDQETALAALSGVAAEVFADYGGDIWNAGIVRKWCISDNLRRDEVEDFETYHEALIAALRQVEVKS